MFEQIVLSFLQNDDAAGPALQIEIHMLMEREFRPVASPVATKDAESPYSVLPLQVHSILGVQLPIAISDILDIRCAQFGLHKDLLVCSSRGFDPEVASKAGSLCRDEARQASILMLMCDVDVDQDAWMRMGLDYLEYLPPLPWIARAQTNSAYELIILISKLIISIN